MPKFHWPRALHRAAAAGVLLTALSTGLAAFAQSGHPSDVPPAPAPPPASADSAPANGDAKQDEAPKEEEKKEEEPAEEEEEEEEEDPCAFLMKLFEDECGNNCLADHNLKLSGWLAQSFTWNPDRPQRNTNGPVSFTDRANEYQLNQAYLIFERTLDQTADEMDFGWRFDGMFGSDYFFTTARGLELEQRGTQRWNRERGPNRTFLGSNIGRLHGVAMPQAYAEIAGKNLSVKVGHFYTLIGYEVVTAPQNFFATHAYTMQYGEPFTHTGVMTDLKLNDNWKVHNCIIQGWDNFDDTNHVKSYLGGVSYTNEDTGTSAIFQIVTGEERLVFNTPDNEYRNDRTMYSIVVSQAITEKLTYVFQHDNGQQQGGVLVFDANGDPYRKKAEWYGINQYLFYQLTDEVKAGVRYEWFRDDDGFRILGDDEGANYHEITAGLNWKLCDCVMLRPEVRWDWCDKRGLRPYDLGSDPATGALIGRDASQFLFTTDLIITF